MAGVVWQAVQCAVSQGPGDREGAPEDDGDEDEEEDPEWT